MINASNEVKCPLLWEFGKYNFSWIISGRLFCKHCKYKEWISFFWVHGEWIGARNKHIVPGFTRFVCPALRFIPYELRKKLNDCLKQIRRCHIVWLKVVWRRIDIGVRSFGPWEMIFIEADLGFDIPGTHNDTTCTIIAPRTTFNQWRYSIPVTWWHHFSP